MLIIKQRESPLYFSSPNKSQMQRNISQTNQHNNKTNRLRKELRKIERGSLEAESI